MRFAQRLKELEGKTHSGLPPVTCIRYVVFDVPESGPPKGEAEYALIFRLAHHENCMMQRESGESEADFLARVDQKRIKLSERRDPETGGTAE